MIRDIHEQITDRPTSTKNARKQFQRQKGNKLKVKEITTAKAKK